MKAKNIFLFSLTSFFIIAMFSCNKGNNLNAQSNNNSVSYGIPIDYGTEMKESVLLDLEPNKKVTYASFKEFFNLTYQKETPDYVEDEQKDQVQNKKENSKPSESVIPGLRKLSEYKTKYVSTPKTTERPKNNDITISSSSESTGTFSIEDWGPSEFISENRNPSFYVIFSEPVKALSSLEEVQNSSDVISIEPELKGKFTWYSSNHLGFEALDAVEPSVSYTFSINKNLKSISGKKLIGKTSFKIPSEELKINSLYGGYIKNSDYSYSSSTGAIPPYENRFYIRLNYLLNKANFEKLITVRTDEKVLKYSVELDYEKNFIWGEENKSDKSKQVSNSFIVTIKDSVSHNQTIKVNCKNSSDTAAYSTLKPFTVTYVSQFCDYSEGNKSHPLSLKFSQKPDLDSLVQNLSVEGFTLKKENIQINGTNVVIFNLPFDYNSSYTLTIGNELKDIYGQKISKGKSSYSFKTRDEKSYIKYIDYGSCIMEAQFPHKFIFEHQNLKENSFYTIESTDYPLGTNNKWSSKNPPPENIKKIIKPGKKNQRTFEEIDLDPYLKKGFGFVEFESHAYIPSTRWDGTPYIADESNHTVIQVTDLAVTARIGLNKAVFMVRKLSNGEPVAKAKITPSYAGTILTIGTTDKNGLCVIEFSEEDINTIEKIKTYYDVQVLVEKDDDKIMFFPRSHNSWREGVLQDSFKEVRKAKQRTFMFVDRGIYKPGETVTFKGIDKNQILGTLNSLQTHYTIIVESNGWNDNEIITTIKGQTSENGSFDGSFKLPDNIKPGRYRIEYTRVGSNEGKSIYFDIAYYERLLFESSIEMLKKDCVGGEKINAKLSASYLAGGALSGAYYYSTWYTEPQYFRPNNPKTKGYTFSTTSYDSKYNVYNEEEGSLSAEGTALLSCNSKKITNGRPYSYRITSYVTDASNQRIASKKEILVHPANYYVGIAKPLDINGFAKKGQKLKFPLLYVDTDGNVLSKEQTNNLVKKLDYTLSITEWTVVNEQSVDDSIYTRYQPRDVEESSGSINVDSHFVELSPKNCGWYTLKINGKDNYSNNVVTEYEFYVSGGSSFWFDSYNSNTIKLTPDQNQYNPGDTAQILLESPLPKGDYLITVEREGIFTYEIKHFDSPSNIIEVPISNAFVPVVYVSVSSYSERSGPPKHEYGEKDLDKPKDYYGVTPIFVDPNVKAFTVKVESDKSSYKPGDTVTLTLTATKGEKPISNAELTVMAVDRGVLDLIDYHVPNPIEYFYNEHYFPLRVKGGDSRALLMDPVTYSVKNLMGGDADEEKDENERKDFRPTAVFAPTLITNDKGQVTCTFKMPDTLTTYRITAFGVKNDYFALKEKEVVVQNPINVQQIQPRRLRERDTAECGVLITNVQDTGINVQVKAQIRAPSKNLSADKELGLNTVAGSAFIDGKSTHKVYIAPGESSVVYFDVAAEKQGTVELVYSIESDVLKEKLVSSIKIEKTYLYETVAINGQTDNEEKSTITEQVIIPSFAKDARGDLKFTLDATRLGVLGSSVNYVFDYPYGCLEQQSSKILPLVLFNEYIDFFGLDNKIGDIKKLVKGTVKDWVKSQQNDGGFPYWPDYYRSDLYVSIRIAHLYAQALNRGYTKADLPINIEALLKYITNEITRPARSKLYSDFVKAYACYVLKLNNNQSLNSVLNSLYDSNKNHSLSTNALIGLAYMQNDDSDSLKKAEKIVKELRKYLEITGRTVSITQKDSNRSWHWYENQSDELALFLQLFVSVAPKDKMVDKLLVTLLQKQQNGYWSSTTTTARVLDAIYTYIKQRNLDNTDYVADVKLNNSSIMNESFKDVTAKPKTLILPFEDSTISSLPKDKTIPVEFSKNGKGYLFYTLEMKYALPDEIQSFRNQGINLEYSIIDYDTGKVINQNDDKSCVVELESGKVYTAKINVSSTRNREYLALRCPVPSGAEILDSTFITSGVQANEEGYWTPYDNRTILDNEVQFFWDTFKEGSKEVEFTFRATRRGIYPTPPVLSECMYESEVFGRSNGYLFQIK